MVQARQGRARRSGAGIAGPRERRRKGVRGGESPPDRAESFVRILLVGDYPPDPRLGSAKVPIKLQEEFRALGHTCDLLLSDGLGDAPRNPYLRQAFGPVAAWLAVRRMVKTHGPYDVVDVTS